MAVAVGDAVGVHIFVIVFVVMVCHSIPSFTFFHIIPHFSFSRKPGGGIFRKKL
jgi:hypothetical protein